MAIIRPSKIFGTPMPFGKHMGKLIERVVFESPEYVHWFYSAELEEQYPEVHDVFVATMTLLDMKPFTNIRCRGKVDEIACTRTPTRIAIIPTSSILTFWCDTCNPCES